MAGECITLTTKPVPNPAPCREWHGHMFIGAAPVWHRAAGGQQGGEVRSLNKHCSHWGRVNARDHYPFGVLFREAMPALWGPIYDVLAHSTG